MEESRQVIDDGKLWDHGCHEIYRLIEQESQVNHG